MLSLFLATASMAIPDAKPTGNNGGPENNSVLLTGNHEVKTNTNAVVNSSEEKHIENTGINDSGKTVAKPFENPVAPSGITVAKTGVLSGGNNVSPTHGNGINPPEGNGVNPPSGHNTPLPPGGNNVSPSGGKPPGGNVYKPVGGKPWNPGKPVGKPVAPVGKPDWNHGWLHPWNGGWKQPSQTTTVVNIWDNYGYGIWPSGMDNNWFWNWNYYAPNTGVFVLGMFNDPSNSNYAQIVLCNPDTIAHPIGGWQFIVDGTLYAFQPDAWIASHSTAMIEVPVSGISTVQVLDDSYNIIAQFEWEGSSVMLGSDWEVHQSSLTLDTFSTYNGLYEATTTVTSY